MKDFLLVGKNFLPDMIFLTMIIALCNVFSIYFSAKALNINIPTSFLLFCYTVGIAISILPISISGIGTREMAYIFLMNLVNIPSEQAIALSVLGCILLPIITCVALYIIALIGENYENSYYS
jgi:uncharacterized membrane protein YbhN (UPF0104 family)